MRVVDGEDREVRVARERSFALDDDRAGSRVEDPGPRHVLHVEKDRDHRAAGAHLRDRSTQRRLPALGAVARIDGTKDEGVVEQSEVLDHEKRLAVRSDFPALDLVARRQVRPFRDPGVRIESAERVAVGHVVRDEEGLAARLQEVGHVERKPAARGVERDDAAPPAAGLGVSAPADDESTRARADPAERIARHRLGDDVAADRRPVRVGDDRLERVASIDRRPRGAEAVTDRDRQRRAAPLERNREPPRERRLLGDFVQPLPAFGRRRPGEDPAVNDRRLVAGHVSPRRSGDLREELGAFSRNLASLS